MKKQDSNQKNLNSVIEFQKKKIIELEKDIESVERERDEFKVELKNANKSKDAVERAHKFSESKISEL